MPMRTPFRTPYPRTSRTEPPGNLGRPQGGRFRYIKKICRFCADKTFMLDYKDAERLRRFLTEKGKIIPSRITGNCAKHQRILARMIKRARHASVIAFQVD